MGVVNVTPDSFSDGGRYLDPARPSRTAASWSPRAPTSSTSAASRPGPGAARPAVAEELDRVVPVIAALAAEGVLVSVDTMRAEVAEAAVEAGAVLVNDVSGGLADPTMLRPSPRPASPTC